ncbi:MAG: triose-phosphate isomerase [Candidatus Omnitrophica bacterium]|nr:triose-phosphate isomerase [Candidatus Omnitrophota bacterium]
MRKSFIAGNWKMYKTVQEAIELVTLLKRALSDIADIEVGVCPPFTALGEIAETLFESNITLGAQDVYWETEGAFTGEVSPAMLKDIGCMYCIVGHSERRKYFHETNDSVNRKLKALFTAGIKPIMCIGEILEEREAGQTFDVVKKQLEEGLSGITGAQMTDIVIAYEPVWAIGTGKTATPGQAQEVHQFIRQRLSQRFSAETAETVRIQYGGSVKPDNITDLMKQKDIDGALVGGASLKADSFVAIVKGALVTSDI